MDTSRLTGIGLAMHGRMGHGLDEPGDIDVRAADNAIAHGNATPESFFIDLTRLSWWDRMRVAWARIGGHTYLRAA